VEPTVPTALYRQIADDLRDAILDGTYPPGARLPTEPELQRRYGCSRNTIRLAVRELTSEGLVETAGRRGTLVRQQAILEHFAMSIERSDRLGEADGWCAHVAALGRLPSRDFSLRAEPASATVAHRLRLGENSLVCVRECMRYVDGHPWSRQLSYYPMDVAAAAGLLDPRDIGRGTPRAMSDAGITEIGHVDEIGSRMPSPEEIRHFGLPAGVPMLIYWRTGWTAERIVRLTVEIQPADRNVLVYELGEMSDGVERAAGPERDAS
jgi:GntR family transcriptional regulator